MLLLLSFLVHILTLAIIFLLFKQIQSVKQHNQQEWMKWMDTYLEDIKKENRHLEETLSGIASQPEKNMQPKTDSEPAVESNEQIADDFTPEVDHIADDSHMSLEAQVLQLHDERMTVENIARKLNCGKTEAELIIKINKQTHNNP
ncbi:DUF6115 domain-containing protein [Lentibacillus salicampi]|uniref:DUF2802 domain-containing protein n=1 Tax=Lentibacillus salicampi TaxID=175306 RepID=A0A4Y9AH01_9BACI|nr:hypothetical protein [Lentibacillus salicampi]TFJ94685.1 hypothetical protein E4U82_01875 [Lentibacillus salicampi]